MSKNQHLEDIKKQYKDISKKYNLPSFEELNELFEIEDIEKESELLLRKIRRHCSEKIINYIRLLETIINPSNAPLFFISLIRRIDKNDKEIITGVYERLSMIELQTVPLDIIHEEKQEAEFIKKLVDVYNKEIRKNLSQIIIKLIDSKENEKKSNGSYFG